MAYRQQSFDFQSVSIDKKHPLGSGAFGAVYKAKGDQLHCAAKILHSVLISSDDTGVMERFQTECQLLSLVRHPNIVQYLSTSFDEETGQPVLLMELCDESLTTFLERSPGPLPYHTELSISHDIALALVYLHSNGLIHRDLSSNNVLMDSGRAKVTDFGMSKLVSIQPQLSTQTLCPGNMVYMPPEALDEPAEEHPSYTGKLDVFSFGVLLVQIMTRAFPDPGPRFSVVQDPRYPVPVRVPIREVERRHDHLTLIYDPHPLKSIAIQCLDDNHKGRPTAQELTTTLEVLKADQNSQRQSPRAETSTWSPRVEARNDHERRIEWLEEQLEQVTLQLSGQRVTSTTAHMEREKTRDELDLYVKKEKLEELLEKEKKLEELQAKEKMWREEKERREKDLKRLKPVVHEVQRSLSIQEQKFGELRSLLEEVLNESTEPAAASDVQNTASLSDSRREIQQDEHVDGAALETKRPLKNTASSSDFRREIQQDEHVDEAVLKRKRPLKCIPISDLHFGDLLARGGQAVVWKGVWGKREVAIKKYTNQPDPRDICVLQEVPPHPNIVRVLGVVQDKFSCSIVMQLMNGGSLYDFIHKKKNTPSPEERFSWIKDIARGMEFLHSREIAHRDLKSANVLLAEDVRRTAMLCDFGTAKQLPHTTIQSTVTGTYRWMAPEIIKGNSAKINMKCDVFSYSMVLCEIVTLNLPFKDSPSDQMAMIDVVTGKRPSLSQPDPNCPPFLYRLISACWSEDPRDRPSFQEINLALDSRRFK